jgi:hypothetical protein
MKETIDTAAIENRFIRELAVRLERYLEEMTFYTPEAGENFAKTVRVIIDVYRKLSSPEIGRYVDMEELEEYILEYFRHYYMAHTKRNGYIFTRMRMDSRMRKGEGPGEREKSRLREHEKEYIEELKKYNLNNLCVKLEKLYKRVVELGESQTADFLKC